ncbi:transcriptional regulator TbsP [Halococcus hamelinensis]|jgi:hypothetical protein|uniref:Transcriptional regulator n=1 Tax=Halococcus hamelinensis 100A6 TaxID=1132509 RepID=M0LXE3_9EURY|nr:DUF5821 family protein [Halococcus hamelinensis]EMA38116.1 hypothetical protein C447_10315 [Halococcus hamelinensis 100A6]
MSSQNLIETDVANVYRAALADAAGESFVVAASATSVERLVAVLDDLDDPPAVRLFAREDTLKTVMDDFIVASTAADLIEDETLSLRIADGDGMSPLVITEGTVFSVVTAGGRVAGLATDDETFGETAREEYADAWADAAPYTLRTPPLSRVRATMEESFGPEMVTDFDGVLASLDTARGGDDGLDEVTISLLVAAKNEELLYDISKWGEDTGVASKATFSRTKTRLEEMDLIHTTKVPIDVGRPRLRLLLGDERLADADADELASVAGGLLSANGTAA